MKNKILSTFFQAGNYRDSFGEFGNTLNGVFEAERVKWISAETSRQGWKELYWKKELLAAQHNQR